MNSEIEIVHRDEEYTLEIFRQIPIWKMPAVIGRSYKQICEYMEGIGIQPSGMPFARYVNLSWDSLDKKNILFRFYTMVVKKWDVFIGFTVPQKIEGSKAIQAGTLAGGKYVQVLHRGSYESMEKTYKKLRDWTIKNRVQIKHEAIEEYLNDPGKHKKEEYETLILVPIVT